VDNNPLVPITAKLQRGGGGGLKWGKGVRLGTKNSQDHFKRRHVLHLQTLKRLLLINCGDYTETSSKSSMEVGSVQSESRVEAKVELPKPT
jgi:hypothetical protein